MKFSKRSSKFLKLCIMVCVCGSLLIGIVLLNKVHKLHSIPYLKHNGTVRQPVNLQVEINPRHILPAFIHHVARESVTEGLTNGSKLNLNLSLSKQNATNASVKGGNSLLRNTKLPREYLQQLGTADQPSYDVHAFYYPWYGTPEIDGKYLHWNHPYIPHWNIKEAKKWPNYTHKPPDDVGSNFYPLLGAYSSRDREVIDVHMKMMRFAKIGVVVVSWYPAGDADEEGWGPDSLMPVILDVAKNHSLKVAIHVEPYKGRNARTMKENLRYIYERYGSHPAFYRTSHRDKTNVPLIYIYDSYLVDSRDWATIFTAGGEDTVRNTDLDGLFIGLLVEPGHRQHVVDSGFDGFFTYFATNKFTYGSTWINWPQLAQLAHAKGLLFIPSVGPGYVDTEVRPWNGVNTRKRLNGKYYNEAFTNAVNLNTKMVSITSFNEWHEGTQIEPAVNKIITSRKYEDYGDKGPNFYLDLTKHWIDKMLHKH